jgi:hypothetical protein
MRFNNFAACILGSASTAITISSSLSTCSAAFVNNNDLNYHHQHHKSTSLFAGKGFGKNQSKGNDQSSSGKTYGSSSYSAPIRDMIDSESAMKEFFSSNEEWIPLFRQCAEHSSVPAMSYLLQEDEDDPNNSDDFEFHENSNPWKVLDPIPTDDGHRQILSNVLDSMQAALISIPVDENVKEDDNDLEFLEEGRRMLVISRFHVLEDTKKGSIESYDSLFATCWNEVMYLRREDEKDTGSLIVVPGADLADLRRFTDINLQRPLEWLGVHTAFEVSSFQRGSPAIRLVHKLSDMPADVEGTVEEVKF